MPLTTCSCGSSWCHRGEQKAHWHRPPGSCCPAGWLPDTWLPPVDHRTPLGPLAPLSVCCSPSGRTACGRQGEDKCEPITDSHCVYVCRASHTWSCRPRLRSRRCWATLALWQCAWLCWCDRKTCGWFPSRWGRVRGLLCLLRPWSRSCPRCEEGTGWTRNETSEGAGLHKSEKTNLAWILFEIMLTFTENIFAAWPVCIVVSFLWRNGSQTMACWSSEPEASKLDRKITFRKLCKHAWEYIWKSIYIYKVVSTF